MDFAELKNLMESKNPELLEIRKHSAVLIPFVESNGKLCLLFEQRSGNISQPGEVCFPGGRMEQGETAVETALRETWEEMAIPAEDIESCGEYGSLVLYANRAIHTVWAFLKPEALEHIVPSEGEVGDWFTVPVDWLLENDPYIYEYRVVPEIGEDFPYDMVDAPDKYNWSTGKCTVPIWHYEKYCLWGITARIVVNLLEYIKKHANM